jgi:FKBP-type peptidyl-prolyl cis-trans isomerase (trigger factor)
MEIISKDVKDYKLNVEIMIDKDEFDKARIEAYMQNTDIYPVLGKAPGLATLDDLKMTYGPAVLFDEALGEIIPKTFNRFLDDNKIRIMGKPIVDDMKFTQTGGVLFSVKADMYPDVKLGKYKGISVPVDRAAHQMEFEKAVIEEACKNMKGEIPPHMIDQKLDALTAQEKISVNGDAIYHLFADMQYILDEAYKAAEAVRPMVQVRREAMDLMLQTASSDNRDDWKDFVHSQLRDMVERYHTLPENFDEIVTGIMKKRDDAKAKRTPEETTEEVFKAYLGSLELTEEQWRNQRRIDAAKSVCMDLLLDAVADEEKMTVSEDEVHHFIEEIAKQCNMEAEEAEANVNKEPLIWKLKRDKALEFILNSAVTDMEAKA